MKDTGEEFRIKDHDIGNHASLDAAAFLHGFQADIAQRIGSINHPYLVGSQRAVSPDRPQSAWASAVSRPRRGTHRCVDRHQGPELFLKTAARPAFPLPACFPASRRHGRAADGTAQMRSSWGYHPVSSNSPRCGGARQGGRRVASGSGAFASRWGIVAKTHMVYKFSDARMARYRELFLEPEYSVTELPSYDVAIASNPFKSFRQIPVTSRYRFLLDDAHFIIEGFIKGPVCRGQIALNVIEDRFWVVFADPDADIGSNREEFLDEMSDYLELPSKRGSTLRILKVWRDYAERQNTYINTRHKEIISAKHDAGDLYADGMRFIWDGDGHNPNAALTIFRHFDSASVTDGFICEYPDSAWIIDYPLLERIHYLLVTGFNVYGNTGHQLLTRLYMDFLRMEGEDNFLIFIPVERSQEDTGLLVCRHPQ